MFSSDFPAEGKFCCCMWISAMSKFAVFNVVRLVDFVIEFKRSRASSNCDKLSKIFARASAAVSYSG